MKGLFITFEGVDGCGKSTQLKLLGEYLTGRGCDVLYTREPGGCDISEKIRALLLDVKNAAMDSKTEALLYAASRAQHVAQVIGPSLQAGRIVLCDRFIDSSLAYQGVGRGLGIDAVMQVNRFAMSDVMPDKTFFLDFPPELAFERMSKKRVHDRLELEALEFHKKLYNGFVQLAIMFPERICRVDASGTKFETSEIIKRVMYGILAGDV